MPKQSKDDAGQEEVQAAMDEATSKGFFGPGTQGKDRDRFTIAGQKGATDKAEGRSANAGGGVNQGSFVTQTINPNAGAPGEVPEPLPSTTEQSPGGDKE